MSAANSTDRRTARLGNNSTPSARGYDVEMDFQETKLLELPRRLHEPGLHRASNELVNHLNSVPASLELLGFLLVFLLPIRQYKYQSSPVPLSKVNSAKIVISLCWAKRRTAVRKGWFCVRICSGSYFRPHFSERFGVSYHCVGDGPKHSGIIWRTDPAF